MAKRNTEEDRQLVARKLREDSDYIKSQVSSYSLKRLMAENPGGVKDARIAQLLGISVEEVERLFKESLDFIKKKIEEK